MQENTSKKFWTQPRNIHIHKTEPWTEETNSLNTQGELMT